MASRYTIVPSIFLGIFHLNVTSKHFDLSRKIRRLIPAAHRPMLQHASATETGFLTIRAFGRQAFYQEHMYDLTDAATKVGWHLALGIRWMNFRLDLVGAAFVATTVAAMVLQKSDAATAGLAITTALHLTKTISGTLNRIGILHMGLNAIGRVLDLTEIPTETKEGDNPPDSWPTEGAVKVVGLTVRYDPASPPALRGVGFSLQPRQRLGVLGRTGAGKTSLANACLRFIDVPPGMVFIDGIDISTVKLARLRSAVAIVPQDPFLFSGTLRSNLDVYGDKSDEQLQSALHRVCLVSDEHNNEKFASLDMVIHPGGTNISHGQRQLVCLARALLAHCRLLILDEATSAIDSITDTAIQKIIRKEFSEATVIVITHKLANVADFDALLVLADGKVAGFGPPAETMANGGTGLGPE